MSATLSASTRRGVLNNMLTSAGRKSSPSKREVSAQEEVNKMLINVKGLRHTVYSINGDEYTGGWKGFKKHGKGTFKWKASGQIYEGNWEDNMRCGFGTLIVPKEDGGYRMEYSGEWKRDKKNGQGSHFYSEHEFYEGQWKNSKRHGWGVLNYEDGTVYEGEWANDNSTGFGILKLTNGNRYEGTWLNGQKDGPGKFYYEDKGQVYEGVWQNGVPRCGEMKDYDRSAPEAPVYDMPKIELQNPDDVIDKARETFSPPEEAGKKAK